jgi:hypothetical protein
MTTNLTAAMQQLSIETAYVYFVAFQYQGDQGLGFANTELQLPAQITAFDDVQAIERYLRDLGHPNALLMGFTLLRTEAVQPGGAR